MLLSENMKQLLLDCYSYDTVDNHSDHVCVITELYICTDYFNDNSVNYREKIAWYKTTPVDIVKYQTALDAGLDRISVPQGCMECKLVTCTNHKDDIERLYSDFVESCVVAGRVLPKFVVSM